MEPPLPVPPDLDKDKDSEASSTPRLKFIHAQLMDSSVGGGCDDDAGDVGSIANALAISMACESARIENAVTVSEMDLAIHNLQQWRQKLQQQQQQQAFIDADEGGSAGEELASSLCPETETESEGDFGDDSSGESSIAILRRLRRELNAAARGDSQSPQPSSADRAAARLAALSSAVGGLRGTDTGDVPAGGGGGAVKTEKVDLSRLTQQSAFLDSPSRLRALDAHAGAGAGAGSRPSPFPFPSPSTSRLSEDKKTHNPGTVSTNSHPTTAETDPRNSASPETRRLDLLISSAQSSALLSAAHASRQSAVASDGESLEGDMEALQDELRELESDFDAVLARLR